jgi:predicted RNase H-like HicB family nuclease
MTNERGKLDLPTYDGGWPARVARSKLISMTQTKPYFVRAEWDEEAAVWVATSDDVPGLVTEAETMEALLAKLRILIPELLDANAQTNNEPVPFELLTRRFETIPRRAA